MGKLRRRHRRPVWVGRGWLRRRRSRVSHLDEMGFVQVISAFALHKWVLCSVGALHPLDTTDSVACSRSERCSSCVRACGQVLEHGRQQLPECQIERHHPVHPQHADNDLVSTNAVMTASESSRCIWCSVSPDGTVRSAVRVLCGQVLRLAPQSAERYHPVLPQRVASAHVCAT